VVVPFLLCFPINMQAWWNWPWAWMVGIFVAKPFETIELSFNIQISKILVPYANEIDFVITKSQNISWGTHKTCKA